MEEFSLDKWLQNKSRKVVTRRGNPVRIICTDRKHGEDDLPIVFLEESNGGEFLLACRSDGRCDNYDTQYDLFFADEEEGLTEFEKEVDAIIDENIKHNIGVRYEALNLLGLARKQIEETNVIIEKEKYLTICDQYYNNGKKEALKDIPRWRYKKDSIPLLHDSFILNKYNCIGKSPSGAQVSDVWVLEIDKLVNLPKEGE